MTTHHSVNTYSDVVHGIHSGFVVGLKLPLGLQILRMLLQALVQPPIAGLGKASALQENGVSNPSVRQSIEQKDMIVGEVILQASLEYRAIVVLPLCGCVIPDAKSTSPGPLPHVPQAPGVSKLDVLAPSPHISRP